MLDLVHQILVTPWILARRRGTCDRMLRRLCSVYLRQLRISSVVRKQPTHTSVFRSNWQMSVQGEGRLIAAFH